MTMTTEHIASAWALANAATGGPWFAESGHEQGNGQLYWQVTDATDAIMQNQFCWCQGDHAANAAFIAASRELVPQLLTALEAELANVARLVEAATVFAHDVRDLIANSEGVAGLHLNGDVADWESLLPGGRFSPWMRSIADLEAALTEIKETDHE